MLQPLSFVLGSIKKNDLSFFGLPENVGMSTKMQKAISTKSKNSRVVFDPNILKNIPHSSFEYLSTLCFFHSLNIMNNVTVN